MDDRRKSERRGGGAEVMICCCCPVVVVVFVFCGFLFGEKGGGEWGGNGGKRLEVGNVLL